MIKIAVCDDHELIRKQLYNHINDYLDARELTANIELFSSGTSLITKIENYEEYDCVFLDIDLNDIINGVEVARIIRQKYKKKTFIIFVTSYDEYKNKVFSLHTFDYINKPFDSKQIYQVLDDLFYWFNDNKSKNCIKMQFKTVNGYISLDINEILYFEYRNRRIDIITNDNVYHMYERMKVLFKSLEKYGFLIPHVSYIINPMHIKFYISADNLIKMTNNNNIPISQLKAKEFRTKYNNFIKENGKLKNGC